MYLCCSKISGKTNCRLKETDAVCIFNQNTLLQKLTESDTGFVTEICTPLRVL